MKRITRIFFLLVFAAHCYLDGIGQDQIVHLNRLSVADNLTSGAFNYFVYKDSDGFVWISSINGLNRFDGQEVHQFLSDPGTPGALDENNIQGLFFEDAAADLWFSTVSGIYRYRREEGRFEKRLLQQDSQTPIFKGYRLFYLDRDRQELWITGEGQFAVMPIDSTQQTTVLGDYYVNLNARMLRLAADSSYCLFRPLPESMEGGLEVRHFSYHREGWTPAPPMHLMKGVEVNAIFPEEKEEKVWIATKKGLSVFNARDEQIYPFLSINDRSVTHVSAVDDGLLAIVLEGKELLFVDKLTRSTTQVVLTEGVEEPVLFTKEIKKIYFDSDQTLWISAPNSGVYFANIHKPKFKSIFNTLKSTDGIKTSVLSMAQDPLGRTWFLTRDGLRLVDHNLGLINQTGLDTILRDTKPYRLHIGNRKRPLIGTQKGLFEIVESQNRKGRFLKRQLDTSFQEPVTFIAELSNGKTIISTSTHGIFELDQDRIIPLSVMKKFEGEFEWIFEDSHENVYLYEVDKGIHRLVIEEDGFSYLELKLFNPQVTGMQEDFEHECIWVSTFSGLFSMQVEDSLQLLKQETPTQALNSILLDEQQNLWMGTYKGLGQYSINGGTWVNHNLTDGLQGLEFNYGASLRAYDGHFFFGGQNGANYFLPNKVSTLNTTIKPLITKILINDEFPTSNLTCQKTGTHNIGSIKRLVLPYDQNTLSFYVAALDYSDPKSTEFRYQLINSDQRVVEGGTKNFIRYANIRPGTYLFRLEASSSDGEWNNTIPAELELKILSPIYRRWWAIAVYFLIFLGLSILLYRFQLKRTLAVQENKRLQELDQFKNKIYANITHEFRTPLAVIRGIGEKIKAEGLKEKSDEEILVILRNTKQLQLLVDQMLDLSKIDAGMMNIDLLQGNIVDFLKTRLDMYYTLARAKDIELHLVFSEETIIMDFDPDKIGKILSNLLSNAIKFTPEEGNIYLQYSTRLTDGQKYFCLQVKDTGIGIAEEDLPKVFERYFQVNGDLNRRYEGTGIGLSLVKELVDLMGGRISVDSQLNQGTFFSIELPIYNNAPAMTGGAYPPKEPHVRYPNQSILATRSFGSAPEEMDETVVLIVEDNEDFLGLLASYFSVGYQVLLARNGEEGKVLAFEYLPDIVITDIMMPGLDGYELCTLLKENPQTQHIPIIMLTAKGDVDSKIFGLNKGADDYLPKIFEAEELKARVKNLIRIRQVLLDKSSISLILQGIKRRLSHEDHAFITQFSEIVLQYLDEPDLKIPLLQKKLGYSKTYINNKVKEITTLTPAVFIRKIRLKKAKELIQDPNLNLPLKDIAHKVGFVDYSHFSECYKKEFNYAPRETPKLIQS